VTPASGNLLVAALFHADDGHVHIAQLCRDLPRRRDRWLLAKRTSERVSPFSARPQPVKGLASPGKVKNLAHSFEDQIPAGRDGSSRRRGTGRLARPCKSFHFQNFLGLNCQRVPREIHVGISS
jgi:hypothetical protein